MRSFDEILARLPTTTERHLRMCFTKCRWQLMMPMTTTTKKHNSYGTG